MFKVNNKDARRRSGVFIVNFEYISHLVLVFLLLIDQVNPGWAVYKSLKNAWKTCTRSSVLLNFQPSSMPEQIY